MGRSAGFAVSLLLAGVLAAAYGSSLRGGFVWDDRPLIVENPGLRSEAPLRSALTQSFWPEAWRGPTTSAYFRPVVTLTYAADAALLGLHPFGFRLSNLLFHLAAALLIYRVGRLERLGEAGAAAAALLFALHPVHVESVAWISGRTDLLCGLFLLAAWWGHLRSLDAGRGRAGWRALSLGCAALAIGSKEVAVVLPALVAADHWLRRTAPATPRRGRLAGAAIAALPSALVIGAVLAARAVVTRGTDGAAYRLEPIAWLATGLQSLASYLLELVAPLSGAPAYFHTQGGDPAAAGSIAGLLLAIALARGIARAGRTAPGLALGLLAIVLPIAPVMAFGWFGDATMAERFLYIPSIGAALLAGAAAERLLSPERGTPRRWRLAAATGLAALLGLTTAARAEAWVSDLDLFTRLAARSDRSAVMAGNLGEAWLRAGNRLEAETALRRALALEPGYALAHTNLGMVLEGRGAREEALRHYEIARRLDPLRPGPAVNAALLRIRMGESEAGVAALLDLAAAHPRNPAVLYGCGEALALAGRSGEAVLFARRALALDPLLAGPHFLLGWLEYREGRLEPAAEGMRRYLELAGGESPWAPRARAVIAAAHRTP